MVDNRNLWQSRIYENKVVNLKLAKQIQTITCIYFSFNKPNNNKNVVSLNKTSGFLFSKEKPLSKYMKIERFCLRKRMWFGCVVFCLVSIISIKSHGLKQNPHFPIHSSLCFLNLQQSWIWMDGECNVCVMCYWGVGGFLLSDESRPRLLRRAIISLNDGRECGSLHK